LREAWESSEREIGSEGKK